METRKSFNLSKSVKVVNPVSNIDFFYGPYKSIEDANNSIPISIRAIGRTVGILDEEGSIHEYWYKNGINDEDLTIKSSRAVLPLYSKEDADKILKVSEDGTLKWETEIAKSIQVLLELGNSEIDTISLNAITKLYQSGYKFKGTANTQTIPEETSYIFYLAIEAGVYKLFGNISINQYSFLCYNGNRWLKYETGIPFNVLSLEDIENTTGASEYKTMSQKAITELISNIERQDILIVDLLGYSSEKVISLKTVTEALEAINRETIQIVQNLGENEDVVMSLKAVTKSLQKMYEEISTPVEVVLETGTSTTKVMSQNAVTLALQNNSNIAVFHGFIDDVKIINILNPNKGGQIIYVRNAETFAYYRAEEGYYSSLWKDCDKYVIINNTDTVPKKNTVYLNETTLYVWNGNTLVEANSKEEEIPPFDGIIEEANIINDTGYNKYGKVYYVKTPTIDNETIDNGVFAYKIRDSYYKSWYNAKDYMTEDLILPIKNKLFVCNKLLYIYTKDLILLTDLNKTFWEKF